MIIDKLKDLLQPANAAESEKANEAPRLDQKALCQLLETTLASIGCTPTWEDERDQSRVASYEYQGGNFLVRIAKDDTFLRLCYPIFLSVDKELIELVREICNQVNLASIGLRAVYTFDEDHLHVNVHFFDNLYLEPSRAKGMLTQSMKEMFSWRDAFVRWMDTVKEKRKKYGANSPEEIEEQYKRLILMIREHELDKSEDTMSVRESAVHHITFSELVQDAVGIKSFVPSLLSVAGDGLSLVMVYEVCFMLGYCYDEMRQYDIGHYYLSLLDGTDNIAHVCEMVNNLANNNDPRVISYIESLLTEIQRRVEEETGKHVGVYEAAQDSEYCEFAGFLLATRVSIYAMRACYKEAALELHEISKYPDLSDHVREVMRRIDRNRSNPDEAPFAPPADC